MRNKHKYGDRETSVKGRWKKAKGEKQRKRKNNLI